jgi:hypothetical protein
MDAGRWSPERLADGARGRVVEPQSDQAANMLDRPRIGRSGAAELFLLWLRQPEFSGSVPNFCFPDSEIERESGDSVPGADHSRQKTVDDRVFVSKRDACDAAAAGLGWNLDVRRC